MLSSPLYMLMFEFMSEAPLWACVSFTHLFTYSVRPNRGSLHSVRLSVCWYVGELMLICLLVCLFVCLSLFFLICQFLRSFVLVQNSKEILLLRLVCITFPFIPFSLCPIVRSIPCNVNLFLFIWMWRFPNTLNNLWIEFSSQIFGRGDGAARV